MARSRSHKHTKFSVYTGDVSKKRKKRDFQLWWIIPITAVVSFLFAMILGNCLGSKVDGEAAESTEPEVTESEITPTPPETADVGKINALFVGLEGIVDNTYNEVARQIPEGTAAISLSMFYSNGSPYYSSDVARAAGKPSGELTLKNIFRYANENEIYVSVPFPSTALLSGDEMLWGVDAAYEIAMIKELYDAGADEVIIRCSAFGTSGAISLESDELVGRICGYLSDIRHKVPGINIGFMITAEDARDGAHTAAIDKINGYADFLAVDMTAISDPEELKTAANSALVNILRYEMRVLVDGGEETLPDVYGVLDSLGIKNRQAAIKTK